MQILTHTGPFSEKWHQKAVFKNANKLHKSSWKSVKIDFLHANQIFFILHAFFVSRGFWLFHVAVSENHMLWDKNVIIESERGLQFCQMFLIQDRTMREVVISKQIKKNYSTLAYDWCILQIFELSRTSRFIHKIWCLQNRNYY